MKLFIQRSNEIISADKQYYTYQYWIEDDINSALMYSTYRQRLNYPEVRCGAVIDLYEQRGENVAYNIVRYHRYIMQYYHCSNLEQEINFNVEHTFNTIAT